MRNKNSYEDYILGTNEEQISRGKDFYTEKMRRDKEIAEEIERRKPKIVKRDLHKPMKRKNRFEKPKKLKEQEKGRMRRLAALAGTIALLGYGGNVFVGVVKENNYQKQIDADANKEYVTIIPKEYENNEKYGVTQEKREACKQYLEAVKICLDSKDSDTYDWKQISDAEKIVIDYTYEGSALEMSKKIITAKIDKAILYGDWEMNKYYIDEKKDDVTYVNNIEQTGFKINGIRSTYSTNKPNILTTDVPKNLKNLANDIIKYNRNNWKDSKDCLKVGLEIGENLEKVLDDHYVLEKDGKIRRIDKDSYEELRKEKEGSVYVAKVKEADEGRLG